MKAFLQDNWLVLVGMLILSGFLLVVLFVRLYLMRSQIKKMAKDLEKNRASSYNKQMTITLMDEKLIELAGEFNKSLDYQKALKLEAEKSRKELKQSISDIAHDLRTPVTVLKGNLQRLLLDGNLEEGQKEYLRICCDKTDILKDMVDAFFELSFYESELDDVPLKKVDITNFAVEFFVDSEAIIREKNVEPKIILPEKSLFLMADEKLLSRMFGNLLNNILKHTNSGFSFSLREITDKGKAYIQVLFTNPVDPGNLPDTEHIFDRTYRGDKARTGGGVGGLGLYIVKLLAMKQRAQVKANISIDAETNTNILGIEILFPGIVKKV